MKIKKLLRKGGFDLVRYHPHFERLLHEYEIDTVLDIGANTGQFALDIHDKLPNASINSFEPLKDVFDQLVKSGANIPHFRAFNTALGNENGTATISHSSFSPSSSLLPMANLHKTIYPKSADSHEETITIKKLDDITSELNLSGNILIKIDVQGYEDNVISGGNSTVKKAKLLLIETSFVSLYENQPLFNDVANQLDELGFKYYGHHGQHWNEKTDELLFQDSIFVNKIN